MKAVLICLFAAAMAGCSSSRPEPVVARIGQEPLTLRQFNKILASTTGSKAAEALQTKTGRQQLLHDVIRGKLVLAAAKEAGIQNRPDIQQRIAQLRSELNDYFQMQADEILGKELLRDQMADADKEAEAYYEKHQAEFASPVEVKVQQMLLPGAAEAAALLGRARQGEDFAVLARQFSQDAHNAAQGGEMDFFGRGQCPLGKEFEEVAFALARPGDLSQPLADASGFRVLRLVSKRPARPVSQEETLFRIRAMCKMARYERVVEDLSKKIKVEIDDAVLSQATVPTAGSTNELGMAVSGGKME